MWNESNVQSASLSKAVLREKSIQGSSASLPACGSAVSESVFRPVAAEQRTHPRSGCTTLMESVPMVERERESFAIRNNCAMIISIYLCVFVSILLLPQDVLLSEVQCQKRYTILTFKKMFCRGKKPVLYFVFQFFGHTLWCVESQFPDQGSNPRPLHQQRRVLTWTAREDPQFWLLNIYCQISQ